MSTASELPSSIHNPRPGVLKTLGICNIIFAAMGGFCIGGSLIFTFVGANALQPNAEVEVKIQTTSNPAPGAGVPMSAGFNPFMQLQDKNFVQFTYVHDGVSLVINLLMFATGIGLLNRRYWAARWWSIVAWVRIVSVCLLWGYFIVGVSPGLSETMAKEVLKMFVQQNQPQAKMPDLAFFTRIYSITNLIVALGVMVITSIYPAISLWLLSRPGVKAAIVDPPLLELEQP